MSLLNLMKKDDLRTKALRPLRNQLVGDNRFIGKPIEISGEGTAIHVTIAGKFGVSITKEVTSFNGKFIVDSDYELLPFEAPPSYHSFKHHWMFCLSDSEKIAEYILWLHDRVMMTTYDVAKKVHLIDPAAAEASRSLRLDGFKILCLENEGLLEPVIDILKKEKYVLQDKREERICRLFNGLCRGFPP